jgi:uncharacterized membrane protein
MRPGWYVLPFVVSATTILGAGLVSALAGIFCRPWARALLADHRAANETRQYAQSLFLERGLGRTRSRNAVLILASRFERCAAVVADTGVTDRVSQADLDQVAAAMEEGLKGGCVPAALAAGLSSLEALFLDRGFAASPGGGDEIAEELLEAEEPKP